jgi:putative ATPase
MKKSIFAPPSDSLLASRLLPEKKEDFLGQPHLMGHGGILSGFLDAGTLRSTILFGPPGCGKSSFVHLAKSLLPFHFETVRGAEDGLPILRKALEAGKSFREAGQQTVVVIEEIDRFTRSQQDVLVPYLERGDVILLGLSFDNPIRALLPTLVSRALIFPFRPLAPLDLKKLLERGRNRLQRDRGAPVRIEDGAGDLLVRRAGGDGRKLLLVLEAFAVSYGGTSGPVNIGLEDAMRFEGLSGGLLRDGESHYDFISAFIKSVRNHDPDAALHYLARMIETGEDPMYVARRLVILASEDIGLANPGALPIAVSCLEAVRSIGLPEARIPLAETAIYLSLSPKSNSAYKAIGRAIKAVREGFLPPVPEFLKNVHLRSESLWEEESTESSEYIYPHDQETGVSGQEYVPGNPRFYVPSKLQRGDEAGMVERQREWERLKDWGERNVWTQDREAPRPKKKGN